MKAIFPCLILALCLLSCGWDTDEEFLPGWEASWLVAEDPGGEISWYRVSRDEFRRMPAPNSPLRITSWRDHLWGIGEDGQVLQFDAESGAILAQYSPPTGRATEVGGGLDELYVCTDDSTLYLFDGTDRWRSLKLPGQPGIIRTRSDRAFLVLSDTIIWKIQEQTLTARDTFTFERSVSGLQNDNGVETIVSHADTSGLFLSRLNYHGQVIRFAEQRQLFDDIFYNPLLRGETGLEFIGNLEVEDSCLTAFPDICGDQFWPVWELGVAFVFRSDSAFLYDLNAGEFLTSYGAFSGRITDGENVIR